MPCLVLIDGNSLLHRAYHALPKTLTTSEGEVVNAVYGFTRMLLKVVKDLKPAYLAVAFDMKGPTFRHLEYEKYKEKRPEMEEDLVAQLPLVKNLLTAFAIPVYEVPGFEGEDVAASLIAQSANGGSKIKNQSQVQSSKPEELEAIVVTGDRDVLQLVDEKTKVYAPLKGLSNPVMFDTEEVWKEYGLKPSQIVDYKALRGDPSDNIPGVPGVGEKTAVELLQKYGTLENIYQHLEELPEKQQKLLRENKEQAELSKKLATITTEAPVELDLERWRVGDFRSEKVRRALEKLQFKSLIKELATPKPQNNTENTENDGQMKLLE
jgi:DNA polymerase-1